MQSNDDPLEDAAVGETRTVTHEQVYHGVDHEPRAFRGTDRAGAASIRDVEIVERDDAADDLRVTWDGDVTKTLPRGWDDHTRVPDDESRSRQWLGTAARILFSVAVTGLVTIAVMNTVFQGLAGKTIEVESAMLPSTVELALVVVGILGIAMVFVWAASGGLPPRTGAGQR